MVSGIGIRCFKKCTNEDVELISTAWSNSNNTFMLLCVNNNGDLVTGRAEDFICKGSKVKSY